MFLEGYNVFFDPYLFDKHLDSSSVIATFEINDNVDCSRLCLTYPDSNPPCLAFDVITNEPGSAFPYTCNLASDTFSVIDAPFNESVLHFEIERFPGKQLQNDIILTITVMNLHFIGNNVIKIGGYNYVDVRNMSLLSKDELCLVRFLH